MTWKASDVVPEEKYLINSLDGVEVLLITSGDDGSYVHLMSQGFEQYLVK